jgi:2-succinyl-6-hydroxy-2,4-cyclohexadiene-1-carboxylate synthase
VPERTRVVLVPGFTQTAASWDGVVPVVREVAPAVAVDVPLADTFVDTVDALGDTGGHAIYVGYSMGGRLALGLALERPRLVRGLVLVSASPGIADPAERAARAAADEELARGIERDGVDAFLARWLAQPMFAAVAPDAPGVAARRTLTRAFLAKCARVLGPGAVEPMWDRLHQLAAPVALVTGTRDAAYDSIARRMLARLPADAVHVRIEGGHALPQEQPAVLGGFVASFARRHG